MTTTEPNHPAFAEAYSLIEDLWSAGRDYGISREARTLLARALTALTDHGLHVPDRPIPPVAVSSAEAFEALEVLVERLYVDAVDLSATLRLMRVSALVAKARSAA